MADGSVTVTEIFRTIQGEGPFAGHRAIFIRLSGCNLQCPACDTDYSSTALRIFPDEILKVVKQFVTTELVVITGGEPFRQNLFPLIDALLAAGYKIQIETNGTLFQWLPYDQITVVCSPKTDKIHPNLIPYIAAYKYVLAADSIGDDGLPLQALAHKATRVARPPEGFKGTVYVQPLDDKDNPGIIDKHVQAAITSTMQHGHVMCLQMHKILNLP